MITKGQIYKAYQNTFWRVIDEVDGHARSRIFIMLCIDGGDKFQNGEKLLYPENIFNLIFTLDILKTIKEYEFNRKRN